MYIQSTQNLDKAEDEFLQKILELCDDNDLGNRYQNMIIENGCVIIKVTQLTIFIWKLQMHGSRLLFFVICLVSIFIRTSSP